MQLKISSASQRYMPSYPKHLFLSLSLSYPKSTKDMLTCCPGDDLIIHEVFLSPHACLVIKLEILPAVESNTVTPEQRVLGVVTTEKYSSNISARMNIKVSKHHRFIQYMIIFLSVVHGICTLSLT